VVRIWERSMKSPEELTRILARLRVFVTRSETFAPGLRMRCQLGFALMFFRAGRRVAESTKEVRHAGGVRRNWPA
jgi:hypothetical protein